MSLFCKELGAVHRRSWGAIAVALVGAMATVTSGSTAAAERLWPSVDLMLGVPFNAPGPLRVEQAGQPDLHLTARWRSRPFETPLFYGVRVALGSPRAGWAVDLLHHKLYLQNNPPEVQSFTLTHGYNIVTAQRLWVREGWRVMAGAGVAVPHVENTVRGRQLPENRGLLGAGYHLAGPAAVAGVGRRLRLAGPVQLSLELRASVSRGRVDVVDGEATLTHAAVYLMAGLAVAPR